MSKPVRVRQDVIDRVGALAESERRSLANMVEVLLEAALHDRVDARAVGETMALTRAVLTERGGSRPDGRAGVQPAGPADAPGPSPAPRSVSAAVPPSVHDVPMRQQARDLALRDGKCSADVARGTKCKLCGKVHG